jgi:hypothetical protein
MLRDPAVVTKRFNDFADDDKHAPHPRKVALLR